ncbi:MAG: DNA-binding domain-containing protein [Rubrivivax sp.]|nr:DNA-binding domain-containing protein [Rubrivivax sp.]
MTPAACHVADDPVTLTAFAAALLDPARLCPSGLRAWNGSDPTARLAVHRNNVVGSLIDALAETFPVVQQLVGEDFFRAMAGIFVRHAPPRSRVLAQYGQDFPAFIARFEPAQSLPYLADVARLEAARVRAYHAADADPVSADAVSLALTSGERMGELRALCHPSVSTLASPHAVVSLWVAHQNDGGVETVDVDAPECAIVLRASLDVVVLRAPDGAAAFVQALLQGQGLGDAVASAMQVAPHFDLTAALSLLLAHDALTSLHLPQRLDS